MLQLCFYAGFFGFYLQYADVCDLSPLFVCFVGYLKFSVRQFMLGLLS